MKKDAIKFELYTKLYYCSQNRNEIVLLSYQNQVSQSNNINPVIT